VCSELELGARPWHVGVVGDVIANVVALIAGIATGYYFEWRGDRATRAQNAELQEKLRALRESIYALGADHAPDQAIDARLIGDDLVEEIQRWIREYQGPDGTISRLRVVRRFLDHGYPADQVMAALAKLDEREAITLGEVIQLL
jgi:hypothetical protein